MMRPARRGLVDEAVALDHVEVRHRNRGGERVRGVRVAVAERRRSAEPSTSTRQTRSETMQPESGT